MDGLYSNNSTADNQNVRCLKYISHYILFYICLFFLIVGNLSTILKILFFLQKPVRKCPCSAYIIAATINDIITLNNLPLLKLLSSFYPSKNWITITINRSILSKKSNENLLSSFSEPINACKVRNYLHMWSTDVSIYILLFASINRYLISLKKVRQQTNWRLTNIFCKYSNAIKICCSTYIIGALISVHHYFNFTVVSNFCIPKHFILWAAWIFDVHCLIPSTLMIFFSILTLRNVRKKANSALYYQRRPSNITKRYQKIHFNRFNRPHVEHQLTSMIITEIIVTILTTLPYATYVLYEAMRVEHEKSSQLLAKEDFIEQLVRLTVYLEPSCGFYIYLFTLTTLRKRFVRIILNKPRFF